MKHKLLLIILSAILGIGLGFGIDYWKNGSFAFAQKYFPQDWTSGLVGYWSFDGPKLIINATATDSSVYGNNGTLGSTTVADAGDPTPIAGISGQALSFDGVNDRVSVATSTSLNINEITIEAWVNPRLLGTQMGIVGRYVGSGNYSYVLDKTATNYFRLRVWDADGNVHEADGVTATIDNWYHVVGVYSSSGIKFYTNGISGINSTGTSTIRQSTNPIGIGSSSGSSWTLGFNGLIDEVRIYNRALSAEEVLAHYTLSKRNLIVASPNPLPNETALKGYWSFDGTTIRGLGATTTDLSGNGNTGTLGSTTAADAGDPTPAGGIIGQALSFDGVDDYVDAGSGASLNITSAITIEAWVRPFTTPGTYNRVLSKANDYEMITHYDGTNYKFAASIYIGGTRYYCHGLTTVSSLVNKWTHLLYTYDGSNIRFYENGVLGQTVVATGTIAVIANKLYIANVLGSSYYFNGLIDDVRIYNRALSPEEVLAHYTLSKRNLIVASPNPLPNETALKGYWSFDGTTIRGLGATTTDLSGNGNTGTLGSTTAADAGDPTPIAGISGQALSFDGVNDYVNVADSDSLDFGTNPFTIEVWLYHTINHSEVAVSKGSEQPFWCSAIAEEGYALGAMSNNKIGVGLAGKTGCPYLSTGTITLNQWYHIVAVIDGTNLKIYINGALDRSQTVLNNDKSTAYPFILGNGKLLDNTTFWTGLIDEVRIYNRALTAEEVLEHYNLTRRNLGI